MSLFHGFASEKTERMGKPPREITSQQRSGGHAPAMRADVTESIKIFIILLSQLR